LFWDHYFIYVLIVFKRQLTVNTCHIISSPLVNNDYFIYVLEIVFIDKPNIPSKSFADKSSFESKLPSQATCGKRKAPSFRIMGGSDSELGWTFLFIILNKFVFINALKN